MHPMGQGGRLASIQVLRAAAALGVTCTHIVGSEFVSHYNLPDALPAFPIGKLGVDVFFVISGFVMAYTSEPYFGRSRGSQEFFLRRVARVVPLYWATTSIILVYVILHYHDLGAANFTPASVLASYLFIPVQQTNGVILPVHGVGWTLNYEMFFYACFSLAVLFSRRIGVGLLALTLLSLVGFNAIFSLPLPFGYWAQPIVLEFVFGMMIGLALREGASISKVSALALVIVAITAIATLPVSDSMRGLEWGIPAALIVGACALGAGNVSCSNPLCRVFSFLGDASYSLYLVHPIVIPLPRLLFPHLIDPATHPWLYAALLLFTAVGAATVVHVVFERPATHVLQWAVKSIFRRSVAEPAATIDTEARVPRPTDAIISASQTRSIHRPASR
jgi:exopolysaccharide production protein ExoZ